MATVNTVSFYSVSTFKKYTEIVSKDENALYFVADRRLLFKGSTEFSGSRYKIVSEYPAVGSEEQNVLYIHQTTGEVKYFDGQWKVLVKKYTEVISDSSAANDKVPTEKAVADFVNKKIQEVVSGDNVFVTDVTFNDGKATVAKGKTSSKVNMTGSVYNPSYDATSRTITLPVSGKSTLTIALGKDLAVKAGKYNEATKEIWLTLAEDGTYTDTEKVIKIPAASLVDVYTGKNTATVNVTVDSTKNISATVNVSSKSGNQLQAIGVGDEQGLYVAPADISNKLDKLDTDTEDEIIVSNSDGTVKSSGKKIDDIVTDAYTKAESDKRYMPLAAGIKPTASGELVTLNDSAEFALQGLKIYGKSTQDGEPTPESPIPIVSVGEGGSVALTINDAAEQSQSLPIPTPNGLPGIPVKSGGNYTDSKGQQWVCEEVDFARGKWVQRAKCFTTDADANLEDISRYNSIAPEYLTFRIKNYAGQIKNNAPVLCDALPSRPVFGLRMECCYYTSIGAIDFNIKAARIETENEPNKTPLELIRMWLAQNPLTFLCMLETPIEHDLSPELIAAYQKLHTCYPTTNLFASDNAGVEVQYLADTKNYVDKSPNQTTALIERTLTRYSNPEAIKIGAYAFYRYKSLKAISVPKVELVENSGLNEAGIEDADLSACKTLQYGAMQGTNCAKVDMLGGGYIADAALRDGKLESMILRSEKTTSLQSRNAFANTPIASGTGYIYVPKSLVEEYKVATNWAVYAAQIRAIEDYPEVTGGAK